MAEEEGFEPPNEFPRYRFSRPPHSTALPFLRCASNRYFHYNRSALADEFRPLSPLFDAKPIRPNSAIQSKETRSLVWAIRRPSPAAPHLRAAMGSAPES